ncbi:MAG TPA: ABC transporter permease [Candidatus Eisenbacteria bacterium]|jgi:phospholipid/cholesterol/gamma-HCH transport system permease protein|nr:ABC transporter permease [Candidatus Eisenbacteria bacterium]
MAFTENIGGATLDGLAYLGGLAKLGASAARTVVMDVFERRRLAYGRAMHQAMAVGIGSLPILSLITFFIGTILALQSAYELRKFGAMQFVADAVAISVSRELGPLITAILVIGRSGSSFAAELGTMKVNEEIDALETMALDPVRFLVAPKLLSMLLMMPCLTIWADFMGVVGGAVFGMAAAGFTFKTYIIATLNALALRDIVTGLIKSLMFGLVITTVGCQEGLRTGLGAEEVGRSTTAAVVKSIFLVIMVDLIFTAMFYVGIG